MYNQSMNRRGFFSTLGVAPFLDAVKPSGPFSLPLKPTPDEREIRQALTFYGGSQWPPEVLQRRQAGGRPTLTLNHLPTAVKRIQDGLEVKFHRQLSTAEHQLVVVYVVRRLKDAQLAYNYAMSSLAEQRLPETAEMARLLRKDLTECVEA